MKLIYILNHYSPDESSHYGHILNLLSEIADNGVDITLIIESCLGMPQVQNKKINVVAQENKIGFFRIFELFWILTKLHCRGYRKTFIRISPKAATVAIIVRRIFGGEVYFWQSGTTFEHDREQSLSLVKVKWFIYKRLPFEFTKSFVDFFVTGPDSMVDYYVKNAKVDRNKIRVLYNDIDLDRFSATPIQEKINLRQQLSLPKEKKILLFVHRLSPVKKTLYYLPYILEKFFSVNDNEQKYYAVIVGDGADKHLLYRQLIDSDIADFVKLTGAVPNREIQLYYCAADIFFNPTFEEGFPRVLLEAMAAGLPVVTTDAGGIVDILGAKQKRFMVSKENRDAFANKLTELTSDTFMQELLAIENVEKVKMYGTKAVAKMYVDLIFSSKRGRYEYK